MIVIFMTSAFYFGDAEGARKKKRTFLEQKPDSQLLVELRL